MQAAALASAVNHLKQISVNSLIWRKVWPVNGGMSVSVTISPSSMVESELIWSLCGNTGAMWHDVIVSVDVRVLLGISSACSISSCFMISSASMAWPGESEPGVAETTRNLSAVHKQDFKEFHFKIFAAVYSCAVVFPVKIKLREVVFNIHIPERATGTSFTSFCCCWEEVVDGRENGPEQSSAWWAAGGLNGGLKFAVWLKGFTVAGHCI